MRVRLIVAIGLALALVAPATALGAEPIGVPSTLSMDEGAVAYYLSPDRSQCAVVDLHWVAQRPLDAEMFISEALNVQLSDATCQPSATRNGVDLGASDYRMVTLSYAYVEKSLTVAGHPVSVDVAWTATGTPEVRSDTHLEGINVGKNVPAHLSGTVLVDGVAWTPNQQTAQLESSAILSYSAAPSATAPPTSAPSPMASATLPATSTATVTVGPGGGSYDGPIVLLMLVAVAAAAYCVGWAMQRER